MLKQRGVALLVAVACGYGLIGSALGEVRLAKCLMAPCAAPPGNTVTAAGVLLGRDLLSAWAEVALAREALVTSAWSQPAVIRLARAETAGGNPVRGDMLMELAGQLGWRGEYAQDRLYALAAGTGDCPAALARANALVLQNLRRSELHDRIADALADPRCRAAFGDFRFGTRGWTRKFLATEVPRMPEAGLAAALAAGAQAGVDRRFFVGLLNQLLRGGQTSRAVDVCRVLPRSLGGCPWSTAGAGAGVMQLPGGGPDDDPAGPFDWQVVRPTRIGGPAPMVAASRRLPVGPGTYELGWPAAMSDVAGQWFFGFGCSATRPRVERFLQPRQVLVVPQGCFAPWLVVVGQQEDQVVDGPRLPDLFIGKAP